ncbi:hypothetical protein WA026_005400 [Henosepilachna vigintioctopunctata]
MSAPPVSQSGEPLPLARQVSSTIYPDLKLLDFKYTLAAMQYGQFITHDISLAAGSSQIKARTTKCCSKSGQLQSDADDTNRCLPIILPENDPQRKDNRECIEFVRSRTDRDLGCGSNGKPVEQVNTVTSWLDLSLIYGNSEELNHQLREFKGGRMRVSKRDGKEWPPDTPNLSVLCDPEPGKKNPNVCYSTGDVRANQNPQLAVFQVIWLREHNKVVDGLAALNPKWSDEKLFQEARKICIAEHQYIAYYEWLPIHLGALNAYHKKLIYDTDQFVNDYRSDINPNVINEFTTAALRYFHSAIAGHLDIISSIRLTQGSLRLSDYFNNVDILEENGNFDGLTVSLATQPQYNVDNFHDSEVTQFLFRHMMKFGGDLKSADIQRSRDHGLASYNDARELCGHKRATTFLDFADLIILPLVLKLEILYKSVDDVDLTVAGSIENHIPGTLAGPTFLCIMAEQFTRMRVGDRFWFENGDQGTGFTLNQLNSIRQVRLSRLLCDNGNDIKYMQPNVFKQIFIGNYLQKCDTLPSVDLSLWKDKTRLRHQKLNTTNECDDLEFVQK